MKLNRLISTVAIPLVSVVLVSTVRAWANPIERQAESGTIVAQNQMTQNQIAQEQVAIATGDFVSAEHPTVGSVRIVSENGGRYLEFDSAFTSDQGPDLHVLLDKTGTPPTSYAEAEAGRYVNLGGLQAVNGMQRYPIPDEIQVSNYQSVVIWCRMANATFGYAPLQSTDAASSSLTQ